MEEEDVTMPPGCSYEVDSPFGDEDAIALFNNVDDIPTLDFVDSAVPEMGQDGMVDHSPLQHEEDQIDWDADDIILENVANDDDLNYPNVDYPDGFEGGNFENVEANGVEGGNPEYNAETNVVPFPVWPPVPTSFNCSYCHVLREIIHENGAVSMKLEIHGRIGVICHAIHEKRTVVNDGPPIVNHEMVDFTMHSLETVRQFLIQYCQSRTLEGYVLTQDPLSVYYSAVCCGLDWTNINSDSDQPNMEAYHTQAEDENGTLANIYDARTPANASDTRAPRDLAEQRRRVKQLTLSNLANYFHLPINEAAEELGMSVTVIKNKCRNFDVKRWPQRRVKSIKRQISKLENSIRAGNDNEDAIVQIEDLRRQLYEIYAVHNIQQLNQQDNTEELNQQDPNPQDIAEEQNQQESG